MSIHFQTHQITLSTNEVEKIIDFIDDECKLLQYYPDISYDILRKLRHALKLDDIE